VREPPRFIEEDHAMTRSEATPDVTPRAARWFAASASVACAVSGAIWGILVRDVSYVFGTMAAASIMFAIGVVKPGLVVRRIVPWPFVWAFAFMFAASLSALSMWRRFILWH
jgi:hypothetical protein